MEDIRLDGLNVEQTENESREVLTDITDINNTFSATEDSEASCRQCRIKSWALWVSVLGLLGMILQNTGIFAKLGLDNETWDMIITLIGAVLTAFGIVNNPTEKKKL